MISDSGKRVIAWILSVLMFGAFLIAGTSKLIGVEEQVRDVASWNFPAWSIYPIGIIEILLAIGFVIPRIRFWTIRATFFWALVAFGTHWQADQLHLVWGAIIFSLLAYVIGVLSPNSKN